MVMDYPALLTMRVESVKLPDTTKPLSPAMSSVAVGTSQSGGWTFIQEGVMITEDTPSISKFGGLPPPHGELI